MKKILFTLTVILLTTSAFAQFTFGPKAALNFSKFSFNVDEMKSNMKPGFDAGVFLRFGHRLYIQPELLYSFKSTDVEDISNEIDDIKTHAIDVPVLLGFKLLDFKLGNLRAFVGPKFSFTVGDDFRETVESAAFNFAGQAGLGVDLLMFTLDFRYDYTFTNTAKVQDVKFHTNAFVISLGWKIL